MWAYAAATSTAWVLVLLIMPFLGALISPEEFERAKGKLLA